MQNVQQRCLSLYNFFCSLPKCHSAVAVLTIRINSKICILLNRDKATASVRWRKEGEKGTGMLKTSCWVVLLSGAGESCRHGLVSPTKESLRKQWNKVVCESWDSRVRSSSILWLHTIAAGAHLTDEKIKEPYLLVWQTCSEVDKKQHFQFFQLISSANQTARGSRKWTPKTCQANLVTCRLFIIYYTVSSPCITQL